MERGAGCRPLQLAQGGHGNLEKRFFELTTTTARSLACHLFRRKQKSLTLVQASFSCQARRRIRTGTVAGAVVARGEREQHGRGQSRAHESRSPHTIRASSPEQHWHLRTEYCRRIELILFCAACIGSCRLQCRSHCHPRAGLQHPPLHLYANVLP